MTRHRFRTTGLLGALVVVSALSEAQASRHTATGTMTAYDPQSRILTVTSATGEVTFRLSSDARVWLGNRRLPVAQLEAHVGFQATVSWSEVDGVRTTHTVRLNTEPGGRTQ